MSRDNPQRERISRCHFRANRLFINIGKICENLHQGGLIRKEQSASQQNKNLQQNISAPERNWQGLRCKQRHMGLLR